MAASMIGLPSCDIMDQTFEEFTHYIRRTHIWLCQTPPDTGCHKLIMYGSHEPSILTNLSVSPVPCDAELEVPFGTFAIISYEIENFEIFHEPVTAGCLPAVIEILIRARDNIMMMDDAIMLPRATDAIAAISRLRTLFCRSETHVPEATESLRAEAPRAFAYAISVVRQSVKHNARPEIRGLYTHTDLDEMYKFGIETIGELVTDPDMIYGAEYVSPMVPTHPDGISHTILKWVAFLSEEIKSSMSL